MRAHFARRSTRKRPVRRSACAVCGSGRLHALPSYSDAGLMRCEDCGFVFAGEVPSIAELTHHYGQYDRHADVSEVTVARYRELLAVFERYRQSNRILDVGCGSGLFLQTARELGWDVYGTEFTDEAIELCTGRGITMAHAPAGADEFAPGFFDAVTAFEVFEHLLSPRDELVSIARATRPGGMLYVTTPNFDSLSRRLLRERWRVIEYPEHLSYFTARTLPGLVQRFGFDLKFVETTGISPAELRRALGAGRTGNRHQPGPDDPLRESIERSGSLRRLKALSNGALSRLRLGDTVKALFERAD